MDKSQSKHNSIVQHISFLREQDLSIERAEKLAFAFTQLWMSDPEEAKQKINEFVSSWSQVLLILQVLNENLHKGYIDNTHPGLYTFIISLIVTQFITEWINRKTSESDSKSDSDSDSDSDSEFKPTPYPELKIINPDWNNNKPTLEIWDDDYFVYFFHWNDTYTHYKSNGHSLDDMDHRNFTREFLKILHDMMKATNKTEGIEHNMYFTMLRNIAIKSNRPVWWKYHRFSYSQILTEYKKSNSYWFEIMYNRSEKKPTDSTNIMCLSNDIIERIYKFLINMYY